LKLNGKPLLEGDFQLIGSRDDPLMGRFSSSCGKKEPTNVLTLVKTGRTNDVAFTAVIYTESLFDRDDAKSRAGELAAKIENY